ncbi:hypothetical protein [Psychroserpens algicola]|uniref:DUF3828 domain-containing protein n=1 Tax=Psychroserpens algicola TaxID=1719034 RepID=A0ABT0H8H7_9FLAO|nr:hypothetical protein [Psychroserpens algicola]MCK8480664.1 hypothetical protein [Psychroserpens algicola]
MKIVNYVSVIVLVLLWQHSSAQYPKIELSSMSETSKTLVKDFVAKALTDCNATNTLKLSSRNATSRFRKFFTNDQLKESCNWYVDRYGNLEEATLIEAIKDNDFTVYRFKMKRSLAEWHTEMRVVLDKKGKLAGVRTKDYWTDKFYRRKDNPVLQKIDTSKLDKSTLELNKSFALKSYQTCESSEMFVVNETNTIHRTLRNDWDKNLLIECDSIKRKNGELSDFKFVEFYSDSVSRHVYRYKVQFDKLVKPSEIRVYSKHNDKFMGIFVIDVWYDRFYEFDKAKSRALNDLGQ